MFTRRVFGRKWDDLRAMALYDLLPALAVGAAMSVDIFQWTGGKPPTTVQSVSYAAVSAVGFTGVLLRRRAPLLVLVTLAIVYKTWAYLLFPRGVQIPFSPILVILVLTYSTAAHTRGRRAIAGVMVLAAFFISAIWSLFQGHPTGSELPFAVVMTAAWLMGKGMQRYRDLTASLRAQARELEQERDERARLAVVLERSRIARELHDVIAHSVSVIVVQAAAERKILDPEQHQTRDVLEMIERTGRQALVEMRRCWGCSARPIRSCSRLSQGSATWTT